MAILLSSCASGLKSYEKAEYKDLERRGRLIEEYNPNTGMVLGFIAGGNFYVGEPALGVLDILTWPLSILWSPVSGYQGSQKNNYDLTKYKQRK